MRYNTLGSLCSVLLSVSAANLVGCASTAGTPPAQAGSDSHSEHEHGAEPKGPAKPAPAEATSDAEPQPPGSHDPSQQERAAYEKAKPLFEMYCASCHTTQGSKSSTKALGHFAMDSYPFGGHHAAEISAAIREVLGKTGSAPIMPKDKPGAVKGDELAAVLAWADAYDRAHAGANPSKEHDHEGHQH
jgi:hypothetical protein